MRAARGVVRSLDGPLAGVLVEVLDHPELVLKEPHTARTGQRRVAACLTGENGEFTLAVPRGKYELRFSKDGGWNWTSMLIEVSRLSFRRRLTVFMEVAT